MATLVKALASAALAFGLSGLVIAQPVGSYEPAPNEGRGCCSHHGGVCGCSAGRALCCDGALSPSCGC